VAPYLFLTDEGQAYLISEKSHASCQCPTIHPKLCAVTAGLLWDDPTKTKTKLNTNLQN